LSHINSCEIQQSSDHPLQEEDDIVVLLSFVVIIHQASREKECRYVVYRPKLPLRKKLGMNAFFA
jgi:hypothetical protein